MHAGIERRLLPGLLDPLIDLAPCFVYHFLNAGRMNAPVGDELLQSDAGHFSAHRIKAGQNDRFRRIVDDEIHSGQSL